MTDGLHLQQVLRSNLKFTFRTIVWNSIIDIVNVFIILINLICKHCELVNETDRHADRPRGLAGVFSSGTPVHTGRPSLRILAEGEARDESLTDWEVEG